METQVTGGELVRSVSDALSGWPVHVTEVEGKIKLTGRLVTMADREEVLRVANGLVGGTELDTSSLFVG